MAKRVGVWLVGARGGVATTAIVGLSALRRGLAPTTGLVTELPVLQQAGLTPWDSLVVAGHETRSVELLESARGLGLPPSLFEPCACDLAEVDARIQPGVLHQSGPAIDQQATPGYARSFQTARLAVEAIRSDIESFRERERLERVVVVLVGSTEPATDERVLPQAWGEFESLLSRLDNCPLRASTLYAIAAIESGCPFVNFTPSLGSSCAALDELANLRGVCHAGRDGKTGETLLKTVLAPMFASRNLEVMSWVGHNILGNADGQVLDSPEHKEAKLKSKDRTLAALLGHDPQTLVSIEYVPSLGERKTAWNHVHFRGFLGCEMTLQLTWGGHDSALAAPLVLDLVRLINLSAERGERGAAHALACFFKDPFGSSPEGHAAQFDALVSHYGHATE